MSSEKIKIQEPEPTLEPTLEPEAVKSGSRKRSITIFVVVSVLNAALLILLWTQLLTPATGQPSAQNSSEKISGDINSPLIGKPAPDFTLAKLGESGSLRLSDFKGKPVVLNFWGSWCEPCKEEAPFLEKSWQTQLQQQGVVLIGIDDGRDDAQKALKFMQDYKITYPNVKDTPDGATTINYGLTGFPETVFIDRNGTYTAKYISALNERDFQLELKKIV